MEFSGITIGGNLPISSMFGGNNPLKDKMMSTLVNKLPPLSMDVLSLSNKELCIPSLKLTKVKIPLGDMSVHPSKCSTNVINILENNTTLLSNAFGGIDSNSLTDSYKIGDLVKDNTLSPNNNINHLSNTLGDEQGGDFQNINTKEWWQQD